METSNENNEALLAAAELLLADVKRQREALLRREQELKESVAMYRARLSNGHQTSFFQTRPQMVAPPRAVPNVAEQHESENAETYGAITESIISVLRDSGRKMNVPTIATALESRGVPIRAKSYDAAVRTAIRRLHDTGKVRRVGLGYYRLEKMTETHIE